LRSSQDCSSQDCSSQDCSSQDCRTEKISAQERCRSWTSLNFLEISLLVNTINVSLYCGICYWINTILATFNATHRNKTNYARDLVVGRTHQSRILLHWHTLLNPHTLHRLYWCLITNQSCSRPTVHSESIQTPWLFQHFVTLQPYYKIAKIVFSPSSIYTQYPIITKKK
jgi:hypothetical protein